MSHNNNKNTTPPDQNNRDSITNNLDENILVEAGAGTGKTTIMVARMVKLIASGKCSDVRNLVAITFTKKAALELKQRFHVELAEALTEENFKDSVKYLEKALTDINNCFIGTIHSFCAKLIKQWPIEAGVGFDYKQIEEGEDEELRKLAWDNYWENLRASNHSLFNSLGEMGLKSTDLKNQFVDNFARFPDVTNWPVIKNKKLPETEKYISKLKNFASQISEISHLFPSELGNDKLILKLKSILTYVKNQKNKRNIKILYNFFESLNTDSKMILKVWKQTGNLTGEDAKSFKEQFENFKEKFIEPFLTAIWESRYEYVIECMKGAGKEYAKLKTQREVLSFSDLLLKSVRVLKSGENIRKYFSKLYTHLLVDEFHDTDPVQAEMILLLTSDNPLENNWKKCRPKPGSLFVVGDPKQSIYRFRRADISTYNGVRDIIEDTGGEILHLRANFRSRSAIINWVNETFRPSDQEPSWNEKNEMVRFEKKNPHKDSDESPEYVPAVPSREVEQSKGKILALKIPKDKKNKEQIIPWESDFIARTIRYSIDSGLPPNMLSDESSVKNLENKDELKICPEDFLIVTYNTKSLGVYGNALAQYGIPYQVTGGDSRFLLSEFYLLALFLRSLTRPDDPVAFLAVLRCELFGVSDEALFEFKKSGGKFDWRKKIPVGLEKKYAGVVHNAVIALNEVSNIFKVLPVHQAIKKTADHLGLFALAASKPDGEVRAGSFIKALEIVRQSKDFWSIKEVADVLYKFSTDEQEFDSFSFSQTEKTGVRVMNLHKCKGLEARFVFLACPYGNNNFDIKLHINRDNDMKTEGYMLIAKKAGFQNYNIAIPPDWEKYKAVEEKFSEAEKLRLRYVAATRAGEALIITADGGKNNPWKHFSPHLKNFPVLEPVPDELLKNTARATASLPLKSEPEKEILEKINLEKFNQPSFNTGITYDTKQAKTWRIKHSDNNIISYAASHSSSSKNKKMGSDWGSAIHKLLEIVVNNYPDKWENQVEKILTEYSLDSGLVPKATQTINKSLQSDILKRALNSKKVFTEMPFNIHNESGEIPTNIKGSIDLAFEEDGWVLVDYKTDTKAVKHESELVKKYSPQLKTYSFAWEKCTGQTPKELYLYFTASDKIVKIQ